MAVKKNIILNKYSWTKSEFVSVTGFAWLNNNYVSKERFATFISENSSTIEKFKQTIENLNGQFSVIIESENEIWLAASHNWSNPLFYKSNRNEITISDDPQNILDGISNPEIDEFSRNYFLLFGVTPQEKTLFKDIQQIKPGEIVVLQKDKQVEIYPYFKLVGKSYNEKTTQEDLQKHLLSLFQKYFEYIKDKQVLLQLTSGYDSRLLACLLKEFGHKNVLCATWGRNGNAEVKPAQEVAKQLGFPHIFVEYNREMILGFSKTELFTEYAKYSGHFSSMPFLQDYFAIDYLKKNKIISADTIAMPGHSGFFAGSHLETEMQTANNTDFVSKIIDNFGTSYLLDMKSLKKVKENIQNKFFDDNHFVPWQNFERWDFQERQCKFISNSTQVWQYFGIEVLMPLFDKEFIDFFKPITFEQKVGANLYSETLKNKFFIPHNVSSNLKNKVQPKKENNYLKQLVLKSTPRAIKNLYYPLNDVIFYREITSELIRSLSKSDYQHPETPHRFNSYIIQWYLFSLQQTFNSKKLNL